MVITSVPAALPIIMDLEQLSYWIRSLTTNFTSINERLCVTRIKGRLFNYSLITIHAPTNDSEEEAKDQFYEQLERPYALCPSPDVKLVMGDANAKAANNRQAQPA
jgi:hypothetical protein